MGCRDYYGARNCGISALLLRRPGPDGESEAKELDENLTGVEVVPNLLDVVGWVQAMNNINEKGRGTVTL